MTPALLLIDLQSDYLASPGLEPSAGSLCDAASRLLEAFRSAGAAVFHVQTTIRRDDERMPHWRAAGLRRCIEGTPGHRPPPALEPRAGELVISKQSYSAFTRGDLESRLRERHVDTAILAGVHLRGCVRATALDAYQRGFSVWIADDAVADDDPAHAAVTRRYLADRIAGFRSVDRLARALSCREPPDGAPSSDPGTKILPATVLAGGATNVPGLETIAHANPRLCREQLWSVPIGARDEVSAATRAARGALPEWSRWPHERRVRLLSQVADRVRSRAAPFARQIANETGKPIRDARLELEFAVGLLRAVSQAGNAPAGRAGNGWWLWRRPQGVIAIITPWNNPLAIPLGKIAPALLYGNTVVWKPAPPGAAIALATMTVLQEAGLPPAAVTLVQGDRTTAERLIADPIVDAVTLTGSSAAGYAAQWICMGRRVPFQGELGGNNAAIVWSDADLVSAARQVAEGGFGSAGQRCTANRRVIVAEDCYPAFLEALEQATSALQWGDPLDEATVVGPMISSAALRRISGVVERARAAGARTFCPHRALAQATDLAQRGWYYPPTLVCCDEPSAEIVQEETFGPVVVVQRARGWDQAISLCNGVRQGLVAALFSGSVERQERFLTEACAGLLKVNSSTAGAAPDAPFGGWKASGVGPPEHGAADIEFYTRSQTVYGSGCAKAQPGSDFDRQQSAGNETSRPASCHMRTASSSPIQGVQNDTI